VNTKDFHSRYTGHGQETGPSKVGTSGTVKRPARAR
jgi:hypothetical protein